MIKDKLKYKVKSKVKIFMAYPQQQLSADQLQTQLRTNGDFLQLTRSHEFSMPAFTFDVSCATGLAVMKVSVLDTGIIIFEPISFANDAKDIKDIVLSSAVHGNETAPIEICNDLIKKLLLGELVLKHRVLFLFGNPPSINIGERFVEENLNRLFSGGHTLDQGQGAGLINKERHRALLLEQVVEQFYLQGHGERLHYDLHTAIRGSKNDKFSVYPFIHDKPRDKAQLAFMKACGINTILLSNSPTTTFSYFSSNEFDAHAFTVELGMVKPFGENDMANFSATISALSQLISADSVNVVPYQADDFNLFTVAQVVNRHHENFVLHFSDDVENFTDFPIGTVIATDGEHEVKTVTAGEAIIFPNANVAIGQRAILTVIPANIDE